MSISMRRLRAGFTLIEILVVVTIIAVLLAVGISQLSRARITTNEQLALNSVRVIGKACHFYYVVNSRYPTNLATLGPTVSVPSYIDSTLAQDPATKQGYTFTYASGGGGATFTLLANPVTHAATGVRHFFVDQEFVIHTTSLNQNASATDPAIS